MDMVEAALDPEFVKSLNADLIDSVEEEYEALNRLLSRRGVSLNKVKETVSNLELALPSWGVGVGGTRFARFPIPGEPNNIEEKIEDCALVQQLGQLTPRISPHFPWDRVPNPDKTLEKAQRMGMGFDAVNSNTFQDQPGTPHSYKYGSLTHIDPDVRAQAIEHNIECIRLGQKLGSSAITVWIGDGSNFPGQQSLSSSYERYLESAEKIYKALPDDWRMLLEHKLYEPAFYSTVISDWGSSVLAAQCLGPKAQCLVDLGHHAPSVNIEQIVARLNHFGKLGGFHFNDSKYGDDDLDSGSINPHQLFLIFNELVDAEKSSKHDFNPAYMIDQSHNLTDPIESLLMSVEAIAGAYARALIIDREALTTYQQSNDVVMAFKVLRQAYNVDVSPLLAMIRFESNGAIDPIASYRASGWRQTKAKERAAAGSSAGIV